MIGQEVVKNINQIYLESLQEEKILMIVLLLLFLTNEIVQEILQLNKILVLLVIQGELKILEDLINFYWIITRMKIS